MIASNFDFLKPHFATLYTAATRAEHSAKTDPRAACFHARFTLEQAVNWLYDNEPYLEPPRESNLGALIHDRAFRDNLNPPSLFDKIRLIHKLGNQAVHNPAEIGAGAAIVIVRELHHFLYWLARYYSPDGRGRNLGQHPFNSDLLPDPSATHSPAENTATLRQLQDLETQLEHATNSHITDLQQARDEERKARELAESTQAENAELKARIAQLEAREQERKAAIKAIKAANQTQPDTHDYSRDLNEAETRRLYIDVLLKEAGHDPNAPNCREYPVTGMPRSTNPSGRGKVDYVLWDDDDKPLALIEAKKTSKSARSGQIQAELYANCLEKQKGQRPIIFYSNGLETYIWDDRGGADNRGYPPRRIDGFLSADELRRLIARRHNRQPLDNIPANGDIAGRPYQLEAIARIGETFRNNHRKALLVMATGTGKTRTAIGLIDRLVRANWVKRVLFLADRTALLTQTQRAIKANLKHTTTANLSQGEDATTADIVLATYPTMFNRINATRPDGRREFGVGYFDLIIVDEAHRSVYQKYKFLFRYFDSLLLGLTATPRSELDRNTFEIFDSLDTDEDNRPMPTFAYEMEQAIEQGYLVPPRSLDIPFKFLRTGIKYADLSPEEQEIYEEQFGDEETGKFPDKIDAKALNRWLFNNSTTDQALALLMTQGIKTEGGDRLGKTIVFARSHPHAEHICDRFNANYPEYGGSFARVIDSHNDKAQALLQEFEQADKQPTIAISVDMLDTGIDVPEVVNLVFFKPVFSRVKYNQMVGRGTRLCSNLFAPGDNKTEFLIFDLYGNAEFFGDETKTEKPATKPRPSLTTQLLRDRLSLSQKLPADHPLRTEMLDTLHAHVRDIDANHVLAREHRDMLTRFRERHRWDNLSEGDQVTIAETLLALPSNRTPEKQIPKEFDRCCCQIQLAIVSGLDDAAQQRSFDRHCETVRTLLDNLSDKANVPQVRECLELIDEARRDAWWTDVTPEQIEQLRRQLRNVVGFADRQQREILYTNFRDQLEEIQEIATPLGATGYSYERYREKVSAFIRDREHHVAIAKLKRNRSLTDDDLTALDALLFDEGMEIVESRERFETLLESGSEPLSLSSFIRQVVGLDRDAVRSAFEQYLDGSRFSANQIRFVEQVIDWLTANGSLPVAELYKPPFTDYAPGGFDEIFTDHDADTICELMRRFDVA